MSYKTILVRVDESRHAIARMELVARMAMDAGAHLIGAATTGMSRQIADWVSFGAATIGLDMLLTMLRERAGRVLFRSEAIASRCSARVALSEELDSDLVVMSATGTFSCAKSCSSAPRILSSNP